MSNIARMMQQATAGAAGAGLDVDEVFSTFLYDGNGGTQSIVNGIDLSGEGGFVWIKNRGPSGFASALYDTVRGATYGLESPSNTNAQAQETSGLTAFNSNGFTLGNRATLNASNEEYVSWTWRKAKKFFDVVTYTGDGTNNRQIAHNLGCQFGMLIVKCTSHTNQWIVWHRSTGNGKYLVLNETNALDDDLYNFFGSDNTTNGSTHFSVSSNTRANESGKTYVAYLFAHNNSDGGFGPDADQDIIKCDQYTGGTTGTEVNVGFEPQFVMVKRTTGSGDWMVFDAMRGVVSDPYPNLDNTLFWNLSNVERTNTGYIGFTPTGFIHQGGSGDTNTNGETYIYMAIRRGPLAVPTDATKVFGIDKYEDGSGDGPTNGIVNDFSLIKVVSGSGSWFATARLRQGHRLKTDSSAASAANSNAVYDRMDGVWNTAMNNYILWGWKRAIGYFDVATYNGNAQASAITVNHNLGVVPEMMWCKKLGASGDWMVYHKDLNGGTNPHTYRLRLNSTGAEGTGSGVWNAAPTATQFSVGTDGDVNADANVGFITFLFATAPGVSKVGSYSGTANTNTIDCGFSNGAKFVIIKDISSSSATQANWHVYDTTRGIVSGNDGYLYLNSSNGEVTGSDFIDPHSSGFQLTNAGGNDSNASGRTYVFYAVA